MKSKRLIGIVILISLSSIQTLTYLTIGQKMLTKKLFHSSFAKLPDQKDSAFVSDFFHTDCLEGDPNIYPSNDLGGFEKELKEKLNVRNLYFDRPEDLDWETTESRFKLVYKTYSKRKSWTSLFGFFSQQQTETLLIDQVKFYQSEVEYKWFLFFWVEMGRYSNQ